MMVIIEHVMLVVEVVRCANIKRLRMQEMMHHIEELLNLCRLPTYGVHAEAWMGAKHSPLRHSMFDV